MPLVFRSLALLLSIAAAFAADKETPFQPPPAGSMAHRQTSDQVTIGADPFETPAKTKAAFAKLDPNQYGVLPVLVVIQNDTKTTIDASHLQVQYKEPGAHPIENTPAAEVKFVRPPKQPGILGTTGKNPLDVWAIEGRGFTAKMIPPGQTAGGFFYFQATLKPGATISLSGFTEAATGKELFYFEIPLK